MKVAIRRNSSNDILPRRDSRGKDTPILNTKGASVFPMSNPLVQRKSACPCGGSCPRCKVPISLQPKLKINAPNDQYEQEADRVAEQVMRMPEGEIADISHGPAELRRKCAACASGDGLCPECAEEEEKIQAKEAPGQTPTVTPELQAQIDSLRGGGQPLPEYTRAFFEPRFGYDFSGVRVHSDARAANAARGVNSLAYTVGNNVVFGAGQYSPDTVGGRRLLAHELTHVVQQSNATPNIQRMIPCPARLNESDPVPPGWQAYHGDPAWFHCGFRGILEDRRPTPEDPQNECFYDHSGALVDESHPYSGCRGTPNQYDSSESPVSHTFRDTGGIWHAGGPAFMTSRVYSLNQAIAQAIRMVSGTARVIRSISDALGEAIALGVLSARASVDPSNWSYQGMPARSVRHLNVMGGIISSVNWNIDLDNLLANMTRRLDGFAISELLIELAEDINSVLRSRGAAVPQVNAAYLGNLSLLQLVDWLRTQGLIRYVRPLEEIAREQLRPAL